MFSRTYWVYSTMRDQYTTQLLNLDFFYDPDWNLSSILFSSRTALVWSWITFSMICDIKGSIMKLTDNFYEVLRNSFCIMVSIWQPGSLLGKRNILWKDYIFWRLVSLGYLLHLQKSPRKAINTSSFIYIHIF